MAVRIHAAWCTVNSLHQLAHAGAAVAALATVGQMISLQDVHERSMHVFEVHQASQPGAPGSPGTTGSAFDARFVAHAALVHDSQFSTPQVEAVHQEAHPAVSALGAMALQAM